MKNIAHRLAASTTAVVAAAGFTLVCVSGAAADTPNQDVVTTCSGAECQLVWHSFINGWATRDLPTIICPDDHPYVINMQYMPTPFVLPGIVFYSGSGVSVIDNHAVPSRDTQIMHGVYGTAVADRNNSLATNASPQWEDLEMVVECTSDITRAAIAPNWQ